MRTFPRITACLALVVCLCDARALTIDTRFVEPGQFIPSVGIAGERPSNASGDGDLASIVRAAADVWESLIADDHRLSITFGWFPTSTISNSAFHVQRGAGGNPIREISGSLAFNNDEDGFRMYLDPTPETSEEFVLVDRAFSDYGTGPIEDTRRFAATDEIAKNRNDVFTAALHEIGHALGLTRIGPYVAETVDGDIDVTLPGFDGATIPVQSTHLIAPDSLLGGSPRRLGERRGVTQLDLLAVCQVSQFSGCAVELGPADYAGDLNGDGVTDAADYTVARDALQTPTDEQSPQRLLTGPVRQIWSDSFGLTFTTEASLTGDFNADGRIDAADYTLWRDGRKQLDYRADADANGRLDGADYVVWAAGYNGGAVRPPPRPTPAPAPAGAALLLIAVVTASARSRTDRLFGRASRGRCPTAWPPRGPRRVSA